MTHGRREVKPSPKFDSNSHLRGWKGTTPVQSISCNHPTTVSIAPPRLLLPRQLTYLNTEIKKGMSTSPNSSTSPSSAALHPPPPAVRRLSTDTQQRQPKQPIIFRHPSFDAATQQVLFQAYLQALRTGQAPMPNISPQGIVTQAQKQANHSRTISDAKRGVTYAGQPHLKKLPIPTLEETCKHYLESVKPFLVCTLNG